MPEFRSHVDAPVPPFFLGGGETRLLLYKMRWGQNDNKWMHVQATSAAIGNIPIFDKADNVFELLCTCGSTRSKLSR